MHQAHPLAIKANVLPQAIAETLPEPQWSVAISLHPLSPEAASSVSRPLRDGTPLFSPRLAQSAHASRRRAEIQARDSKLEAVVPAVAPSDV